tara:strand:+ start:5522 stop:5797 length:276 start_codon:yes stop_codon:yes gene_type:complete
MFAVTFSHDNQYFVQTISAKEFIDAEYDSYEYDDREINYRNLDKHQGHILTVMCESFEGLLPFAYEYPEELKVGFKCLAPQIFEIIKSEML